MPGGWLHSPIWVPYALYGTVDYIYGFPAWEARNGFTAAHDDLRGGNERAGEGSAEQEAAGVVGRREGAEWKASGVGGAGMNEAFSGFANIGHNDALSLLFLWIIPNGAWIALPSYMVYVFGQEILEGLALASNESIDSEPARDLLAIKNE
ncbi:hypothetical protein MMC24_002618 [Lignoscripta atroalba]|nr:hypothetical protein [Lignoscripta atroalba]